MPGSTLESYFEALRAHDWPALGECLAEDVHRTGPYGDVVEGRDAYVAFLEKVVPGLRGWRLDVSRIVDLGDRERLVLLSETVEMDGVATEFPEALLFELDDAGRIRRVDIYIKQPPRPGRRDDRD